MKCPEAPDRTKERTQDIALLLACNPSHASSSKHGKRLDASSEAQPALAPLCLSKHVNGSCLMFRGAGRSRASPQLTARSQDGVAYLSKMAHKLRPPVDAANANVLRGLQLSLLAILVPLEQCLCLLPLAVSEVLFTFPPMAKTQRGRAKGVG